MIQGHRLYLLAGMVSLSGLLAGCVSQDAYDALKAQNDQLQQQVQAQQTQITEQQAQIGRLHGAIKYTVNSDLLFASGSWQMRPQGQAIIARLASKLAPDQQNKVIVNGYTDNQPIGSALAAQGVTSNQILSQKRAEAVMQYIVSQGVKPEFISAVGHGEADPVASNDTPAGRAQNRRVELTLGGPT